jgi:hypothetical protein
VRTHCPTGMECLYHPETGDRVCAWYTDRVQ